jgi:uncharacterized FlaG/YvyC family protein
MEINSVIRGVPAPAVSVQSDPDDKSVENREVVQAVKAINNAEMLGDNELEFQRDPQTQRMLVRVVNRKTREVVSQVPPEYVIRLAEEWKQQRL